MAYVSLYRKYRPQRFGDVIGQDHVVGTLVNAIGGNQVHHALLFAGTRGTGKTTTARLLAKALNCDRGPTPEPCNACDHCQAIADGTHLDVVEIDAASHGSVDDTRELRERASYAPASARFKVYIVDEAHMVSPQGFNAMLKILEEPPEHVRFVFATTEPHKVIEAIRSRCQRHDFRRVPTAVLADYFGKLCAAEGVDIEPAALETIARAGDGSVRDGLSRLDHVLTSAGKKITLEAVARLLGTLPVELRFELADALAAHQVADALECVERVVQGGYDLNQFVREALEHLRDLFVTRLAPEASTLVDVTPETRERLRVQAERFGPGELVRLVRLLGDVYLDLRTATDPRLVLEVGLARAAVPEASLDADALLARVERLERRLGIAEAGPPATAPPAAAPAAPQPQAEAAPPPRRRVPPEKPKKAKQAKEASSPAPAAQPAAGASWEEPPAAAAPLDLDLVRRSWPQVLERVRASSKVAGGFLERSRVAGLEGKQVLVEFASDDRFYAEALVGKEDRIAGVRAALQQTLGGDLELRVVVGEGPAAGAAPAEPAAEPPPPEPVDVDPANDKGEPLGGDADVRAVADWTAAQLGGTVIEERRGDG